MNASKTYITTPIFYVNASPHIGHCYTMSLTDSIARFLALRGQGVCVQTGTDEHGQKISQSAAAQGLPEQELCDRYSDQFKVLAEQINFCASYPEFDGLDNFDLHEQLYSLSGLRSDKLFNRGANFLRTTEGREANGSITPQSLNEGRHIKYVQSFWSVLQKNGWIYKGHYSGWYSVRDESFFAENELIDGKAPTGAEVVWQEEESYFFRLSEFQDFLMRLYLKNDFILPNFRAAEVMSFVSGEKSDAYKQGKFKKGELKDLCISRVNLDWGVPVPGDEEHKVYVWLDALTNYKSALVDREHIWQESNVVHVMGKDIIRFHAVYWPAFIAAYHCSFQDFQDLDLDDYIAKIHNDLPSHLIVHGWWTNEGEKISKSLGNAIVPSEEIAFVAESVPASIESYGNLNIANINNGDIDAKLDIVKLIAQEIPDRNIAVNNAEELADFVKLMQSDAGLQKEVSKVINSKKSTAIKNQEEVAVDYFKYFILKSMSMGKDSDYSRALLKSTINTELVNNVGNLFSRTMAMLKKNKLIESIGENSSFAFDKDALALLDKFNEASSVLQQAEQDYNMINVINCALKLSSEVNVYIEEQSPWSADASPAKVANTLMTSYLGSIMTLQLLYFVIPTLAGRCFDYLGLDAKQRLFTTPVKWEELLNSLAISSDNYGKIYNSNAAFFPRMK